MLEDRFYMRGTAFDPRRSVTVMLLIALVAAFILQLILYRFSGFPTDAYLALSVEGLRHGYIWQLLTYQFMHGGWLHLLLNCWAIFIFGRELEAALGRTSFLALYFSSGVIGGLIQALAGLLMGGRFAQQVVGASAGAFGLVAAFAMLYPERPLMLLLFFVIPLNMRAKYLLVFSGLLAALGVVFPSDNIAHAAHLGGMLTGIFFARYAIYWHWRWPRFKRPARRPPPRLARVQSQKSSIWNRTRNPAEEDMPAEEFLSREVDPILDKISAQGIQSLTQRERRILEAAREKMAKH